jgi:hypothetical protein
MSMDRVIYPKRRSHGRAGSATRNPANYILALVAVAAAVAAVLTVMTARAAFCSADLRPLVPYLFGWLIGPPIWFWVDYFVVYRIWGDPQAFDSFKHAQHVSLAIWASIGIGLFAVANSEQFRHETRGTLQHVCEGSRP